MALYNNNFFKKIIIIIIIIITVHCVTILKLRYVIKFTTIVKMNKNMNKIK